MPDVLFHGETFQTANEVPAMALLKLARAAKSDEDSDSVEGFSALYDLLEQVVDASDWDRFQDVAMRTRAKGDDLVDFLRGYVAQRKAKEEAPAAPVAPASPSSIWD
jgi:hypothetical protein